MAALAPALLAGCATLPAVTSSPATCNPEPPVGASAAAVAYARAVDATYPARLELSDAIAAQGMMMTLDDIAREAEIDRGFLSEVARIDFPPEAAGEAAVFVARVKAEDRTLLQAAREGDGWYGEHLDLVDERNASRAEASTRLRRALGLPRSSCALNNP